MKSMIFFYNNLSVVIKFTQVLIILLICRSAKTIKCLVEAFHAAVETIAGSEEQSTKYIVEGGASKFFLNNKN